MYFSNSDNYDMYYSDINNFDDNNHIDMSVNSSKKHIGGSGNSPDDVIDDVIEYLKNDADNFNFTNENIKDVLVNLNDNKTRIYIKKFIELIEHFKDTQITINNIKIINIINIEITVSFEGNDRYIIKFYPEEFSKINDNLTKLLKNCKFNFDNSPNDNEKKNICNLKESTLVLSKKYPYLDNNNIFLYKVKKNLYKTIKSNTNICLDDLKPILITSNDKLINVSKILIQEKDNENNNKDVISQDEYNYESLVGTIEEIRKQKGCNINDNNLKDILDSKNKSAKDEKTLLLKIQAYNSGNKDRNEIRSDIFNEIIKKYNKDNEIRVISNYLKEIPEEIISEEKKQYRENKKQISKFKEDVRIHSLDRILKKLDKYEYEYDQDIAYKKIEEYFYYYFEEAYFYYDKNLNNQIIPILEEKFEIEGRLIGLDEIANNIISSIISKYSDIIINININDVSKQFIKIDDTTKKNIADILISKTDDLITWNTLLWRKEYDGKPIEIKNFIPKNFIPEINQNGGSVKGSLQPNIFQELKKRSQAKDNEQAEAEEEVKAIAVEIANETAKIKKEMETKAGKVAEKVAENVAEEVEKAILLSLDKLIKQYKEDNSELKKLYIRMKEKLNGDQKFHNKIISNFSNKGINLNIINKGRLENSQKNIKLVDKKLKIINMKISELEKDKTFAKYNNAISIENFKKWFKINIILDRYLSIIIDEILEKNKEEIGKKSGFDKKYITINMLRKNRPTVIKFIDDEAAQKKDTQYEIKQAINKLYESKQKVFSELNIKEKKPNLDYKCKEFIDKFKEMNTIFKADIDVKKAYDKEINKCGIDGEKGYKKDDPFCVWARQKTTQKSCDDYFKPEVKQKADASGKVAATAPADAPVAAQVAAQVAAPANKTGRLDIGRLNQLERLMKPPPSAAL